MSDSFAGTSGALLSARAGETGATWTKQGTIAGSTADAVISNEGRVRKNGTTYGAMYTPSGLPSTANYSVTTDIVVKSVLANDVAGVVGRVDTTNTNGTFYVARYEQATSVFLIHRVVNGTYTYLGGYNLTAVAGSTYRLSLDMNGSTIRLILNGVERVSVVDTGGITAAGRAGFMLGHAYTTQAINTTVTDTTGMHLDNFLVLPSALDAKSANNGYYSGPTLGATSSLSADTNAAVTFDGVDDYVSTNRQIGDDFSVEFLFKSTQGLGSGAGWWSGAGLVDADFPNQGNDFGVSLSASGRVIAGEGASNVNIFSGPGFNDGEWHHVVMTRTKSTGVMQLFVDGVSQGRAVGSTVSLSSSATMSFGRINSQTGYFAGSLDEVALYSVALTASQVSAHHSAR